MEIKTPIVDPRVQRLDLDGSKNYTGALDDQFGTFVVFHQKFEGEKFEHVGIVHAPDPEIALISAKEQYGRRLHTNGLGVAANTDVLVFRAWDKIENRTGDGESVKDEYTVFEQKKSGLHPVYLCTILASDPISGVRELQDSKKLDCLNVWLIKTSKLFFLGEENADMFQTTPDKKFREARGYTVRSKIGDFKKKNK